MIGALKRYYDRQNQEMEKARSQHSGFSSGSTEDTGPVTEISIEQLSAAMGGRRITAGDF